MSFSSYSNNPTAAVIGQVVEKVSVVGRYQCSEAIPPGRFVELHTDGKLRLPQTASAIGKIVGVSMYKDSVAPSSTGYAAGDYVPVLRKGKIWVENDGGGSPTALDALNVQSSSTVATYRGMVTLTTTSASTGVEIYALPEGHKFIEEDSTPTMALVELNFPA